MALKHSNPQKRLPNKARAPYNFIPLPEKVVTVPEPLPQDTYEGGYTGWIDCALETCSPTYIRGMMTEVEFKEQGRKKPDELTPEEKKKRAPFFASAEAEVEGRLRPVIPGSSLRGMIRQLVEIVGCGRMRWAAPEPKVSFRAVAAPQTDPLKKSYEAALGKNGAKVKAGYLAKTDKGWEVVPTWTLEQMELVKSPRNKSNTWLEISDERLQEMNIPGYIPLHDPNYRPQLHPISFDAEVRQTEPDKHGKRTRYTYVTQVGPRGAFRHRGVLVCSGNMSETQQAAEGNEAKAPVKTNRARQIIVLPTWFKMDEITFTVVVELGDHKGRPYRSEL